MLSAGKRTRGAPPTTARTIEDTARARKDTGLRDPTAALAITNIKDSLIALAKLDSTAGALLPLLNKILVAPFVDFTKEAYITADTVLEETPQHHFEISGTVYNGAAHARGLSEARVMLMDRVAEELREKLEEGSGVSEKVVGVWKADGLLGADMLRKWLGEILNDMGGTGWGEDLAEPDVKAKSGNEDGEVAADDVKDEIEA
jgi:hypothetical protein